MDPNEQYIQDIIKQHNAFHKRYVEDIETIEEIECGIVDQRITFLIFMEKEELQWNTDYNKLVKWISKHKKLPSEKSSNSTEKYVGNWIKEQKDRYIDWLWIRKY